MPNPKYRHIQLSEEIAHKISEFLQSELSEKYGLLTCTHVELSGDKRNAKAWISIYPPQAQRTNIDNVIGPVKKELIDHIKSLIPMKNFPHFEFILDNSADTIDLLDKALDNTKEPRRKNEI